MKTIFCPVDFSKESNDAATWASLIAGKTNARLVLFNKFLIFPHHADSKTRRSEDSLKEAEMEAMEKLQSLKNKLCENIQDQNFNCVIDTNFGIDTEDVIINAAEKAKAKLIVMGTKGAQSWGDVLGGSNTSNLIEETDIPVIVLPGSARQSLPDTFVFATDMEGEDEVNLALVLNLANELDAKVIFLHVNDEKQPKLAKLKEVISRQITQFYNMGKVSNISYHEIMSNNFYGSLEDFTNKQGNAMMVLGRHPRNFFEKLVKGDSARLMSLYTQCPLLVLHKKY